MPATARFNVLYVLVALGIALAPTRDSSAQSRTATVNVSINGLARLTLSSTGVSFPDSNPDLVPQVPGVPSALAITVKARTTLNATLRLSVLASDNLRSGIRTLPASNITWTATGAGLRSRNAQPDHPPVGGLLGGTRDSCRERKVYTVRKPLDAPDRDLHADDDLHAELAVTTTSSSTSRGSRSDCRPWRSLRRSHANSGPGPAGPTGDHHVSFERP